jgi:tetratricopeptide (TPR) repeat protein
MVGAFGEVQVMDWGFAKVLEEVRPRGEPESDLREPIAAAHGLSQSGVMMGTPAYMPPEQARAESARIDARADVFALGAILCEILTGRPPYAGGTADDIWRHSAAGDVGDAHARLDACRADPALRDVAKRCLAAERSDRPADAGAVARDVTAYLASAQERLRQAQVERAAAEARAAEAGARVKAERRARRLTVALSAALLAGTSVASWQAVAATRAKHTADVKEAETRAVLDFVQKRIFAAARPEGQAGGLGRVVTLYETVKAALPGVDSDFADQPLTEARLHLTLGDSFRYLGDFTIAADQYERARTIYTRHLGPDHPDTLTSTSSVATSQADLGRYTEAFQLRQEVLDRRRSTLGPDHPDTLRSLHSLADSHADLGEYDEAVRIDEEVLDRKKALFGPDDPETLVSMSDLGRSYSHLGQYLDRRVFKEQASPYHQKALRLHEDVLARRRAALGPEHPDTLASLTNLANAYTDLELYEEALPLRLEMLNLDQRIFGPDHPVTLSALNNLANAYGFLHDFENGLKYHAEALTRRKVRLGPDHPDTLNSMWGVARKYLDLKQGIEALPIIDEALRLAAGKDVHPALYPGLVTMRMEHFEKVKDAAGCRATAELWEALHRTDPSSLYNAGCFRAVTAKVLRATDPSPAAARAAADDDERAMAWLRQAVAHGYKNTYKLTTDADLSALKTRADFQALLAQVAGR